MAQIIARRFAAVGISSKAPGYHADGANLYLRHGRGWIFRFSMAGRTRDMGLGSYPGVSLVAWRNESQEADWQNVGPAVGTSRRPISETAPTMLAAIRLAADADACGACRE